MTEATSLPPARGVDEPMIDAREAAASLSLPYYWFADQKMRTRYRIPHYRLGALVRFRRAELHAWAARQAVPSRAAAGGEADVVAGST